MARELTHQQKIVHFLNRVTFGPTIEEVTSVQKLGLAAYLERQLQPETIADSFIEEKLAGLKTISLSSRELLELYPPPKLAAADRRMSMQGPHFVIFELQRARLLRAVYSKRQLFESMVDFWTNHFNVFAGKGVDRWLVTAYDRDTIRPQALGRFRDLLLATAQSPAMLFYLDNWLSVAPESPVRSSAVKSIRRTGLNENYARELLELHTLGVDGGYNQKDVEEVARCFTGWTIRQPRGEAVFHFESRFHDPGEKIVLGTRIGARGGIEDGIKVIDLLARQPSTAHFISTKLARRFVADDPPATLVRRTARVFQQSNGDIREVLRSILTAPEFFSPDTVRNKVKKPLEFVASALRVSGAETNASPSLLRLLARMGEPLFRAFAPAGFPDMGSSWVSADALLTRMNFVLDLTSNRIPGTKVRSADSTKTAELIQLVAPEGLASSTRAALSGAPDASAYALVLAAPDFQRR